MPKYDMISNHGPLGLVTAKMPAEDQEKYWGKVAALEDTAVHRQGYKALASKRPDAAAHEAGHAVMFASFGIPVASVEIFPEPWPWQMPEGAGREYWCGLTNPDMKAYEADDQTPPHRLFEQSLSLLAGWTAEQMLRGAKFRQASSANEVIYADDVLERLAAHLKLPSLHVRDIARREAKIRLETNIGALIRVEAALLRHRKIDREQAQKLLADVKVEALSAVPLQ